MHGHTVITCDYKYISVGVAHTLITGDDKYTLTKMHKMLITLLSTLKQSLNISSVSSHFSSD